MENRESAAWFFLLLAGCAIWALLVRDRSRPEVPGQYQLLQSSNNVLIIFNTATADMYVGTLTGKWSAVEGNAIKQADEADWEAYFEALQSTNPPAKYQDAARAWQWAKTNR